MPATDSVTVVVPVIDTPFTYVARDVAPGPYTIYVATRDASDAADGFAHFTYIPTAELCVKFKDDPPTIQRVAPLSPSYVVREVRLDGSGEDGLYGGRRPDPEATAPR